MEPLTGKEKQFFDKIRAWPGIQSDLEARAGVEALRLNAALNNQTLEEHLASDFETEMIGAPDAALRAAAQEQGGRKKGAVRFDPETGKAMISAFEGADVSTVIHEGAHVLRRKLAGEYLAEAERVFGVKNGVWTEQNEEDFAGAYEKYIETGKAPTSKLAELFQKLKEFMGRIYGLVKNEKKLSPEQAAFFDRVFQDAQANLETMENQNTGKESAGTGQEAMENPYAEQLNLKIDELNRESREKAREIIRERGETPLWQPDMSGEDGVINDPEAGYTEKAGAIVDKAGKVYAAERLLPADRKHGPTAALISRAMGIADPAARERVIGEIRALRDRYAGTDAEFTAPNGEASLLLESLGEEKGREAWYAVRTDSFKKWFGDWEAAARIAEIEGINPVSIKTIENTPEKTDVKTIFKNFGTVKNEH
ncbi:MAG: hypothetical protein LBK27_05520, partial [Treponema sp.]|nr:hypothetical protein [Treponema sp.]